MILHSEYSTQVSIRNSDKSVNTSSRINTIDSLISSETWESTSDNFESAAEFFSVVSGLAAGASNPTGAMISRAAAAAAAAGIIASKFAEKQAAEAKAKEAQQAQEKRNQQAKAAQEKRDRQARERRIRENNRRSEREHRERMDRGHYRDPPTAERMGEIGRTC